MIRRLVVAITMVLIAAGFSAGGCMGTVQSPSGLAMPTGDVPSQGATFRPLYWDDYNTPKALGTIGAADATWDWYGYDWSGDHEYPVPDSVSHPENRTYYAPLKVASVHDGYLDLYFHTAGGRHYLATLNSKTNQLYGRYAIRMKASNAMPGYHVTPLLWPLSDGGCWPRNGEVDFPDVWMDSASAPVNAFMHRQDAQCNDGGDQDYFGSGTHPYQWVTWIMDWLPNKMVFYKQIGTGTIAEIGRSTARVPNTQMRWVIQFDGYGFDHPIADATQGHVLIDWVVAYKKL